MLNHTRTPKPRVFAVAGSPSPHSPPATNCFGWEEAPSPSRDLVSKLSVLTARQEEQSPTEESAKKGLCESSLALVFGNSDFGLGLGLKGLLLRVPSLGLHLERDTPDATKSDGSA